MEVVEVKDLGEVNEGVEEGVDRTGWKCRPE